ncbi:hypothetical protein [Aquimarina brevivitae]|uniref:HEAT repeat protein n=1 Tax=Aquimarina brevivitae TaxID=323412 RepID=A0A4Q7NTR0_9FLAO|nr:hypothetical protein [Aquimarina brevivitae]RZS90551.1 hypothetical protein EV197_3345 [Aquimarina brevivitae]
MTYLTKLIDEYSQLPLIIQLAWAISALLIVAIIFLIIALQILRKSLRIRHKEKVTYKKRYEGKLINYLYGGGVSSLLTAEQQRCIEEFKNVVHLKHRRKIIVSILFNLMNQITGEMTEAIKTFYFKTGLIDSAIDRLHSKKWHVVAKSISELSRFNVCEAKDEVAKFIHHPRPEVRTETQLYFVTLFKFDGLHFLDEYQEPLSEWVQIQLLEILNQFDDQQICDITPWLQSTNDSVVRFALKLAQIYNQFEVKDTLMELLTHPTKDIRLKSIQVLTSLYGIEAKEVLKANFESLSIEEQISFFKLLEKLVMPDDEPFVEKHLFHKNFEVQLLAVKILKSLNKDKFMGLSTEVYEDSNPKILEFVKSI